MTEPRWSADAETEVGAVHPAARLDERNRLKSGTLQGPEAEIQQLHPQSTEDISVRGVGGVVMNYALQFDDKRIQWREVLPEFSRVA